MMRPQSLALPPVTPDGLTFVVNGNGDNAGADLERQLHHRDVVRGAARRRHRTGSTRATILSPLDQPNTHGSRTFTDTVRLRPDDRVLSTGSSRRTRSATWRHGVPADDGPVGLRRDVDRTGAGGSDAASPASSRNSIDLTWTDNATDETGFTLQRAVNGGAWADDRHGRAQHRRGPDRRRPRHLRRHDGDAGQHLRLPRPRRQGRGRLGVVEHVHHRHPGRPRRADRPHGHAGQRRHRRAGSTSPTTPPNETGFTIQRNDNGAGWANFATLAGERRHRRRDATPTPTVTPGNTYDYRVRRRPARRSCRPGRTRPRWSCPAVPTAPTGLTATAAGRAAGRAELHRQRHQRDRLHRRARRQRRRLGDPHDAGGDADTGDRDLHRHHGGAGQHLRLPRPRRQRADRQLGLVEHGHRRHPGGRRRHRPASTATLQAGRRSPSAWTDNATNETALHAPAVASTAAPAFADPDAAGGRHGDATSIRPRWPRAAATTTASALERDRHVGLDHVRRPSRCRPIPAAPTGIAGIVKAGPSITLTWTDNATNESGFTLAALGRRRRRSPRSPQRCRRTRPATSTPRWPSVPRYAYRVRAVQRDRLLRLEHVGRHRRPDAAGGSDQPGAHAHQDGGRSGHGRPDVDRQRQQRDRLRHPAGHRQRRSRPTSPTFTVAANADQPTRTRVAHGSTYYYRVQAVNVGRPVGLVQRGQRHDGAGDADQLPRDQHRPGRPSR